MSDENKTTFFDRFFSERTSFVFLLIGAIIFIVSIFVFLILGNWSFSSTLNEEKIGQYGDFIGGVVGCLFALVGVILYYIALRDQRRDFKTNQQALGLQIRALNQQITEFQEQKKELEATRLIYEQQSKTMKIQQFESNFYSFLNVYLKIKNELNDYSECHDFFREKYSEIGKNLDIANDSYLDCHIKTIDKYASIFIDNRGHFSQYFKTIYRLMKIIDTSMLSENEKWFYGKIVRSQITDYELLILYYNYHSIFGNNSCSMILSYNFLKHLQPLSKIEFYNKYEIAPHKRNDIIFFTEWISKLLQENINNAFDLESDPVRVSEKFEKYSIIVDIDIDINISVKCSYHKDIDRTIFPLAEEDFKDFICHFLYDKLFFSQFSIPKGNEIEKSTISTDDKIIFSYFIQTEKPIKMSNDKNYSYGYNK